jgi:hypothetical protein
VRSAAGTASAHGVRQVWLVEVLTSAPGGSDSNCKVITGGAAATKKSEPDEQAASAQPDAIAKAR